MKINIQQQNLPQVYRTCEQILSAMDYTVECCDIARGIIHGFFDKNNSPDFSVMDLRITRDKDIVTVAIFASLVSKTYGNLAHDLSAENEFVERLLESVSEKITGNFFKLMVEEYAGLITF